MTKYETLSSLEETWKQVVSLLKYPQNPSEKDFQSLCLIVGKLVLFVQDITKNGAVESKCPSTQTHKVQ